MKTLMLLSLLALVGCGGGSMSSPAPSQASQTPSGPFGYSWTVKTGKAPQNDVDYNEASFSASNASLSKTKIVLTLSQKMDPATGIPQSIDGGVVSTQKFGYGTYQFSTSVSGDVSGSVAASFLYLDGSATEIDFEQLGNEPRLLHVSNWTSETSEMTTPVVGYDATVVHNYRFVWSASSVVYYVDGQMVATHTTDIPSAPANFMFWYTGSNKPWGGSWTPGTRTMTITNFSFTPGN